MSIKVENLNYIYGEGSSNRKQALFDVSFEIPDGQFVGIIGHTGCGKSTLIQHLNGLLKASSGKVYFGGEDIYAKGMDLKKLRQKVGLVFQYPEHQLFEVDVLTDICFGPKNQGLTKDVCMERAREAMRLVGLDESYEKKSPFDLSGGQKRRVAIAGVLAMKPEVLVLDEPTAGLDPTGRDEILDQIEKLHEETGITVILVSHSMEDVAHYCERVIVIEKGRVLYDDTPANVFMHCEELESAGLLAPQVTIILHELKKRGMAVSDKIISVPEAADEIARALKKEISE